MTLRAVVWDFDLTLADTRRRNLRVTRRILREITGRRPSEFEALASVEVYDRTVRRYRNWQELYLREFGVSEDLLPRAGRLWTRFHLEDDAPLPLFGGVEETVRQLERLPHGVVSMNSRETIARTLSAAGLDAFFRLIVGYEEVGFESQKPAPDGLLLCVERLTGLAPGPVLYVGDHETDVECAVRANRELARRGAEVRVVTVAAAYGAPDLSAWRRRPDHTAIAPGDVASLARRYLEESGGG